MPPVYIRVPVSTSQPPHPHPFSPNAQVVQYQTVAFLAVLRVAHASQAGGDAGGVRVVAEGDVSAPLGENSNLQASHASGVVVFPSDLSSLSANASAANRTLFSFVTSASFLDAHGANLSAVGGVTGIASAASFGVFEQRESLFASLSLAGLGSAPDDASPPTPARENLLADIAGFLGRELEALDQRLSGGTAASFLSAGKGGGAPRSADFEAMAAENGSIDLETCDRHAHEEELLKAMLSCMPTILPVFGDDHERLPTLVLR